jgi:hypothetical protein
MMCSNPEIIFSNNQGIIVSKINRGQCIEVKLDCGEHGCPNYNWTVTGSGFHFHSTSGPQSAQTSSGMLILMLCADSTACGKATVKVADDCGVSDSTDIWCYEGGTWTKIGVICDRQDHTCNYNHPDDPACDGSVVTYKVGDEKWMVGCGQCCQYQDWGRWENLNTGNACSNPSPPCGTPNGCSHHYNDCDLWGGGSAGLDRACAAFMFEYYQFSCP